jgi:hypothetical protein
VDVADNDHFLKLCIETLGLNEKNRANTISMGKSMYICYMQDYIMYVNQVVTEKGKSALPDGVVHNYLASLVNIEGENVHGNAVVFKLDDKDLVDADKNDVFEPLANFYYVKCFQVRNGELVEFTLPNIEPVIADLMKDKKKYRTDLWEFYMPNDSPADLSELGIDKVDIRDYNNLVVLKRKEHMGPVWDTLASLKKQIKPEDLRGLYEDLDREYIKRFFSV